MGQIDQMSQTNQTSQMKIYDQIRINQGFDHIELSKEDLNWLNLD